MQTFLSLSHSGCNDFRHFYNDLPCLAADRPYFACKILGITPKTLSRYLKDFGRPPPAMVRLLFFESGHGIHTQNVNLHNHAQFANQRLGTAQSELERLTAKISKLEAENDRLRLNENGGHEAANSMFYQRA